MPADRLLHPKCGKSHKVNLLTDLEYRVWTQYLLSADDFGVMHATAVQIQSDNLHLANRPAKVIKRCLDELVKYGLLRSFTHQGQPYVFSHNWQRWQKVEYPRATDNPTLPTDALEQCEDTTRALMTKYPGGQRKDRRRTEDDPNDLERASHAYPEGVPPTRAGAPAKRLTANGSRLTAVVEEGPGETPAMDVWWLELKAVYPQNRVMHDAKTQHEFVQQLLEFPAGPRAAWALMQANLALNVQSHEWRVKGMAPALLKYLEKGLWQNVYPADPPAGERLTKSTNTTMAAVSELLGGKAS